MDMGCLIAGVRMNTGVRLARPDASASRAVADYLEGVLGLPHRLWHESPGPQGSTTPVPYTHLGAHETKANIVSRLLPQKKK